ncbi:hypothetical protein CCP3SC5AM1_60037 [Gammaproteobacteria bacterium]
MSVGLKKLSGWINLDYLLLIQENEDTCNSDKDHHKRVKPTEAEMQQRD